MRVCVKPPRPRLGDIEDQSATEALVRTLEDREAAVRLAAVEALGSIEDPKSAGPVAALLRDTSRDIREAAANALGSIEDKSAVPALIRAIGDQDADVRVCRGLRAGVDRGSGGRGCLGQGALRSESRGSP